VYGAEPPTHCCCCCCRSSQVGSFPNWDVWSEWNGKFRDDVRRFIKGDAGRIQEYNAIQCSLALYSAPIPASQPSATQLRSRVEQAAQTCTTTTLRNTTWHRVCLPGIPSVIDVYCQFATRLFPCRLDGAFAICILTTQQ
jgi:hypothetical protein